MKVIKKSNLSIVTRKYTDNAGQEKSIWKTIGEITTFQNDNGQYSSIVELYHMPGVRISVFDQTPKAQSVQQPVIQQEEEIQISDIPF